MYSATFVIAFLTLIAASSSAEGNFSFIVELPNRCDFKCREAIYRAAVSADCHACSLEDLGKAAIGSKEWLNIKCDLGGSAKAEMIKQEIEFEGIEVDIVEEDFMGEAIELPWNIDNVDGRENDGYRCPFSLLGESVIVAVFDTGCTARGTGFEEIKCRNFVGDYRNEDPKNFCADNHGHGTAVSAIAAGTRVGVAPYADIACLRVLSDKGRGRFSYFIAAANAVASFAAKTFKPIVINLSLAGPRSKALNDAVKAAANAGVYVVIAAGNFNSDASSFSPGSSADSLMVFSVGAHDKKGRRASFSNYGPIISLSAPGTNILTRYPDRSLRHSTGTSMAAPHVSGAIAALLSDGQMVSIEHLSNHKTVEYPGGIQVPELSYSCFSHIYFNEPLLNINNQNKMLGEF